MHRILHAIALAFCLSPMVAREGRATPEQMQALRQESAGMMEDPEAKYARIPALFMRGNPDESARLRTRFETRLAEAKTDHERAVLHFLVAEAVANEALYCRLQARSAKPPEGWRKAVADRYLAAFKLAAAGSDTKLTAHISQQFLGRIPSAIQTGAEGTELAKRIVAEFIEPVEALPGVALPETQCVRAYKALGIIQRLWAALPATPPEESDALDRALEMAVACECQEKALLFADAVWRRYDQSLRPQSVRLLDAARVLAATPGREADAWRRLHFLGEATRTPWLDLYHLAPKAHPQFSRAERLALLDTYLKPADKEDRRQVLSRHADVVRLLMDEGAYPDALHYADLAIALPWANHERFYPSLFMAKGDCLARLGRKDEARQAYQRAMAPTPSGYVSPVARIAENRIVSLDATKVEE